VRYLGVGLGIAIAAFVLGRVTAPASTPVATASAGAPPAVVAPAGPCVARLSDDDLRRLHDSVAADVRAPSEQTDTEPSPAKRDDPEPTREQVSAGQAGASILDHALAAGHWTDDDARAMRSQLGEMAPDDITATTQRFAAAINAGTLRIDTNGPPL
jgi:hypothetical protein